MVDPLSLIITGAAGTGKSRIIHAACDFLSRRNQLYRIPLLSYTGIAAQNINGVTLHSALSLSTSAQKKMSTKTRQDLIKMWTNVDFLFIDEYSMVGCHMLYRIHRALVAAKESSKPFGGVNIIFAGDFAQLPAVGETRLYAKLAEQHTSRKRNTTKLSSHLENIYGKLLWLSVRNVIRLQTVERQQGADADKLISLLARLREGRCTDSDYDLLSERVASKVFLTENVDNWRCTPMIVCENHQENGR